MNPLPRFEQLPAEFQATIEWLLRVEDYQLAKQLMERVLEYGPADDPALLDYRAMVLYTAKFYREAQAVAEQTLKLVPGNVGASYNLARCLNASGQPDLAEQAMKAVLVAEPQWSSAIIDMAVYICAQGRFDEASAMLEGLAKKLPTGHSESDIVRFNLGWHLIRQGQFKQGMEYLRIGRKLRVWGAYTHQMPRPVLERGMDVQGKTVVIMGEGGAGDEIINVRFAQTLRARGARVWFVSNQKLENIFARSPAVDKAFSSKEFAAHLQSLDFDYWAPAMDMPQILDLDLYEIPSKAYLSPAPEFINKWKKQIPSRGKIKVGLRWQGNPLYERDLYRSVPFKEFESFLSFSQFEFYSLQRDTGLEEMPATAPVTDLSARLETWEDTLAAISQLDLVITSCTSIAHMAAALGKRVFVYTPINHYYIWASPGNRPAWYQDVTLFKQTQFGKWNDCTQLILEQLHSIEKNVTRMADESHA